jgi:hypothetical protein
MWEHVGDEDIHYPKVRKHVRWSFIMRKSLEEEDCKYSQIRSGAEYVIACPQGQPVYPPVVAYVRESTLFTYPLSALAS